MKLFQLLHWISHSELCDMRLEETRIRITPWMFRLLVMYFVLKYDQQHQVYMSQIEHMTISTYRDWNKIVSNAIPGLTGRIFCVAIRIFSQTWIENLSSVANIRIACSFTNFIFSYSFSGSLLRVELSNQTNCKLCLILEQVLLGINQKMYRYQNSFCHL